MGTAGTILLVLLTILFPPAGVLAVTGCSCALLINVLLTILGYIPGHIHAFYVEYLYYKEREERLMDAEAAGAVRRSYGTVG